MQSGGIITSDIEAAQIALWRGIQDGRTILRQILHRGPWPGIPCSLLGMVEYCATTKWHGDLVKRPTFVEAVQRVMQHKTANYVGGGRALDPESLSKPKSLNGYIMAHFQPDYPKPTYPEVFTDKAIIEFVTYSYDTPRPGMP